MDPEVAGRPDAEELEAAERPDQVAEVRSLSKAPMRGSQSTAATKRRDREHCERPDEAAPAFGSSGCGRRMTTTAATSSAGASHTAPGRLERADERGARGRQRKRGAGAPSLCERPGQQRRDQREQQRAQQLLDPAPERVPEQDRRLCRDERREGAQRPRARSLRPARRRARAPAAPRETSGTAETARRRRTKGAGGRCRAAAAAGGVADRERGRESPLVGRRLQAGKAAPVLHHPVGHREVGRGVVELDVAGERRCVRRGRSEQRRRRRRPQPLRTPTGLVARARER